jgi:hypothetical protein
MRFLSYLTTLLVAALITACGGGGGSPGATTVGGVPSTAGGTITLELVDSTGATTTTVGSIGPVFVRATLQGTTGTAAGQVVTFTGDTALVRFLPESGTALTDPNGVAIVQVLPATATSSGAGSVKADATVGGKALKQGTVGFDVPAGGSDVATSRVADFVLLLDKSTLPNSGTSTAKLTVVAVDANNNVVADATVKVSTDANTIFTRNGGAVTDAQGNFSGQIGRGNDKTDRTVVVTVTVNGIVKETSLVIAGSQIELSATPSLLVPGASSTLSVRLMDASSQAIAGKTVSLSGDIASLVGRQVITDANGNATLTFTAPSTVGSYVIQATGSGVTKQLSIQVGASVNIPVAVIPVGARPALSAIPNVLSPNSAGSTTNQSQLRFLFLDANNQPVPNVRVRFAIASTGLGSSDSAISTGSTTVYTNASGIATASFIPGATGSPTDGVVVRACYQADEFTSATQCVNNIDVHMTIAAQALAVSIGNDNLLIQGSGTYIKQFVVSVADAAGRAVPNAPVDISLDITDYLKGSFAGATISCANEDTNRSGFVDPGENINNSFDSFGQPTLEPRRSDLILSYVDPAVRTTNASGILRIQVEYSQRFATWLLYRIRATTSVAGSQGSAERSFRTTFIKGDEDTGSFLTPPYGAALDCTNPN